MAWQNPIKFWTVNGNPIPGVYRVRRKTDVAMKNEVLCKVTQFKFFGNSDAQTFYLSAVQNDHNDGNYRLGLRINRSCHTNLKNRKTTMKTGKQLFAGILIGVIIGVAFSRFTPGRYQVHVDGADIVKWDTWTGNVWTWDWGNKTNNSAGWMLLSK